MTSEGSGAVEVHEDSLAGRFAGYRRWNGKRLQIATAGRGALYARLAELRDGRRNLASRAAANEATVPVYDEMPNDDLEDSSAIWLAYGVGLDTEMQMHISACGSVIGDSYWSNDVENQILGPKAASSGATAADHGRSICKVQYCSVSTRNRSISRARPERIQFPVHSIACYT